MKNGLLVLIFILVAVPLWGQDDPQDAPAFTRRGVMTIRVGRYDEGIKDLDRAIKMDPENSLAYLWRGKARIAKGLLKESIEDFTKVITLEPDEPTAYIERASVKSELNDKVGARADMDIAVKLQPSLLKPTTEAVVPKKSVNKENADQKDKPSESPGKHDKGKELSLTDRMGKLLDLSEDDLLAERYYQQGVAKIGRGDLRGAIADYDTAIRLAPKFALAYNKRGTLKGFLGDYKEAILDFDKALQFDPNLALAYFHRGVGKIHMDDYKGAIKDYDAAIRIAPKYVVAYENRGAAKNHLRDYNSALTDLDTAIRLDPNRDVGYFNRGASKYNLRDYKGAIADWEKAIQLDPSHAAILTPEIQKARQHLK